MKIHKKQVKLSQSIPMEDPSATNAAVNAKELQDQYTVRSMFKDLHKWDGFLKLYSMDA